MRNKDADRRCETKMRTKDTNQRYEPKMRNKGTNQGCEPNLFRNLRNFVLFPFVEKLEFFRKL
jgi:hypothetical protein